MMKIKSKIVISIFVFVLIGCGVWTNLTTFFNTYYNARELFEQVETEIELQQNKLFSIEPVQLSNASIKKLDKVIEKTSRILELDTTTAFLDNALFMTGKAFYYKGEYTNALRKFNELSNLNDSELSIEGILWAGKASIMQNDPEAGLDLLEETKTKSDSINPEVLINASIFEIAYLISSENYLQAIKNCNSLLNFIEDDELKSEVYFQLGQLQVLNKEKTQAKESFKNALDYEPSYYIELESQIKLSEILQEENKSDEALEILESLLNQSKFNENVDQINLHIGIMAYNNNEMENSFNSLAKVDTALKNTEFGGIAKYYQGLILEDYIGNYDSAAVLYSFAAQSQASREIRDFCRNRIILINRYNSVSENIYKWEKQLLYNEDPSEYKTDSLRYEELIFQDTSKIFNTAKLDSLKRKNIEDNKNTELLNSENKDNQLKSADPNYSQNVIKRIKPIDLEFSSDTLTTLLIEEYMELANLFFTEFDNQDSAKVYYDIVYDISDKIYNDPNQLYALGSFYEESNNKSRSDSLFNYIYDNFQKNPIVNQVAKSIGRDEIIFKLDPAELIYMQAEKEYSNSEIDSSIYHYSVIPKKYPKSKVAAQALYTIGWIYENDLNLIDSAVVYYKKLSSNYRSSIYTKAVITKLNFYLSEKKRIDALNSIKDSSKLKNDSIKTPTIKPVQIKIDSTKTEESDTSKISRNRLEEK